MSRMTRENDIVPVPRAWPAQGLVGLEAAGEHDKGRAFLRLFVQNQRRLYAYILTLVLHRADADDVFQEVSLILWDKFDTAQPPNDFAAWACRIAYFKVLDYRKKHQRDRLQFNQELLDRLADSAFAQGGALQLEARNEALAGCISKLGAADRDLLARRFTEGASVQAIAAEAGRSAEAVYKALAKIRKALFDCVTRTLARGEV
jgi:RNA polymerase sigma-70 factor (ECF subfamily)